MSEVLAPLRSDLIVKKQTIAHQHSYIAIIKDPVKKKYFRFEEEEYFVLKHLDGKITAEEISQLYNRQFYDTLTGQDIDEFISSIKSNDLLEKNLSELNTFLYEQLKEQRKSKIRQAKGSALYFRMPIVDPDIFFHKVMPYIQWVWARPVITLLNMFMISALIVLFQNYADFKVGMSHIFDFSNQSFFQLFVLWATVMSVIAIHEMGHGLTCRRFGGECHEIGFLFMFFNPCMYANVNDAWLFENKKHRLYVTFAGCFIEFLVGSIAVYVWVLTQKGALINMLAFKVVVVCFFSAIFMNFNPLMKFDGYFALSDYLEMPNLRDRSKEYFSYLISTKIFRLKKECDSLTKRERWILGIFGFLVTIYMINVMTGLIVLAGGFLISQFHGVGVIVLCFVMYMFFGRMFTKFINFIRLVMTEHNTFFSKPIVKISGLILVIALLYGFIFYPFPQHLELEAALEPVHQTIIRAHETGYVETLETNKLHYKNNGIILTQSNSDLQMQLKDIDIDLRTNDQLQQTAMAKGDAAELLKLKNMRQKLTDAQTDLKRRLENLTLYAPFDGIFESNLNAIAHTILNSGDEIGRYIDTSIYKVVIDILERDIEGIRPGTRSFFIINTRPSEIFSGQVTTISPIHIMKGIARFYRFNVEFPNKNMFLREGMKGTVYLEIGKFTYLYRVIRWLKKTIRLDLQL
ncbi:MAG: efflux RND transporter periplasmic adaptor subunit [Candidatus Magnetomorum sp.]|nr:efflux RND transporter periplasmic adaptor subunit [Candidatus Magnetomorum sp.]